MTENSPEKKPMDRWEARQQRRAARWASREARWEARWEARGARLQRGGWMVGAILILLGGIFLLQNMGYVRQLQNWWALFLLIPALLLISQGFSRGEAGKYDLAGPGLGALLGGLLLLALTIIFFFGVDVGPYWPLFLVAGGLILLIRPRRSTGS